MVLLEVTPVCADNFRMMLMPRRNRQALESDVEETECAVPAPGEHLVSAVNELHSTPPTRAPRSTTRRTRSPGYRNCISAAWGDVHFLETDAIRCDLDNVHAAVADEPKVGARGHRRAAVKERAELESVVRKAWRSQTEHGLWAHPAVRHCEMNCSVGSSGDVESRGSGRGPGRVAVAWSSRGGRMLVACRNHFI